MKMSSDDIKKEENVTSGDDVSLLEKKIIRQVEYYFGDVNLPRDKFLKEKLTEDEGWITLECLTTFNRLKMLSTDLEEIKTALSKSKNGLMQIHETDLKVRRSLDRPLPNVDDPMVRKASKMKTLYIKGFPESYTLDDVQDFLFKQDVQSVFIKLRRDNDHKFKGSIFVELTMQEEADKLLKDKELKCEETILKVVTREEYYNEKGIERGREKSSQGQDKKEANEDKKLARKPGSVFHFKGVGENTTREDLKALFGEYAPIAWVDFNKGETQGFVRFNEEGAAQKVIDAIKAANDAKVLINGEESIVRVIEGEEEDNYWKMVEEDMKKQRNRKADNKRKGRGGKNKHFKRKRSWEENRNEKIDSVTTEVKIENEHKHFDPDGEGDKNDGDDDKNDGDASLAKKVKVESEV